VKDNPIIQEESIAILKTLDWQITVATAGEQAVKLCASRSFNVILIDLQLLEMEGPETVKQIRTMEEKLVHSSLIIAITTSEKDLYLEKCLAVGMNDYIEKPLTAEKLLVILGKYANNQTRWTKFLS